MHWLSAASSLRCVSTTSQARELLLLSQLERLSKVVSSLLLVALVAEQPARSSKSRVREVVGRLLWYRLVKRSG